MAVEYSFIEASLSEQELGFSVATKERTVSSEELRFVSEGGVCEPEPLPPSPLPFTGEFHNRTYIRLGMTEDQLREAHWKLTLKLEGLG